MRKHHYATRCATTGVAALVFMTLLASCRAREEAMAPSKGGPPPPRPPLALSLHIGVKRLSKAHYGAIDPLQAPVTDARAMQRLARSQGFTSPDDYLVLNENARSDAILALLDRAARDLHAGDTLLVTFSGHGCLLPDKNNDEPSGYDSAWCLYDRALVDDELHATFARFQPNVHVFVVSDSCHSGSIVSFGDQEGKPIAEHSGGPYARVALVERVSRRPALLRGVKQLTYDELRDVYAANKALYDGIQARVPGENRSPIKAAVGLLAACQDDQVTEDGPETSAFTSRVLALWNDGLFSGTLESFYDTLRATADTDHVPNLYFLGSTDTRLLAQRPFTPVN